MHRIPVVKAHSGEQAQTAPNVVGPTRSTKQTAQPQERTVDRANDQLRFRPRTDSNAAPRRAAAYLCRAVFVKPPEGWVEVVEVGRVRAGAQAYLGPRPGVGSPAGDMMVDGVLFPLGEALRPLGLWRPSTRTWRQQHAGSRPRCIGDIQALRAREVSRRRERLVSEFSKCVVAAFEQLASKRQARAVTAEPLGGLPVVVAVRRPWTPGGLGGLV
jgi:hypothetical protein